MIIFIDWNELINMYNNLFSAIIYFIYFWASCAEVTFKVKTRLHKLLKSSNNKVKLTSDFPKDNNIEFESPLLSIPYLLKTDVKTIPANIPYLKANSIKVAEWKNKLSTKKFKVCFIYY